MNEPLILDGKILAAEIQADLQKRTAAIIEKTGIKPVLATILVGDNPASVTYVRMKGNACARVGIDSLKVVLPETTTTEELLAEIEKLNNDKNVSGILLQHPVPAQIDEQKCFNAIAFDKDTSMCFRHPAHCTRGAWLLSRRPGFFAFHCQDQLVRYSGDKLGVRGLAAAFLDGLPKHLELVAGDVAGPEQFNKVAD